MDVIMDTPVIAITSDILKLVAEIDEFKGAWRTLQNLSPDRLNILRKVATIESVGSSTRIEGAKLTDSEVERLLSGIRLKHFRSRDEQEVAGYANAMNIVFESFKDIPVTENYIKQLHNILLKYSVKDIRHRGEYKKLSNNVEAFDTDGKSLGVVFKTASPFDTPGKMQELVEWFNEERTNDQIHVLVLIAIFIVHFLAIHPFQDGNGRLSRVLTTLLLLKADYLYVPYASLERVIEENKDKYYIALRRAQLTLYTDNSQVSDWISFFMNSLKKQAHILELKLHDEKELLTLPKLSQDILVAAREHGRITVRDIQRLTQISRNTIKAHFKKLVQNRQLIQEGKGKGTWYRLS